jgi:RecB family endonuclease NucS
MHQRFLRWPVENGIHWASVKAAMYKLNKGESQLKKLKETSLSEQNFLERADLEAWIANHPDVLGEDLLVLETEHPLPTKLRIDILALDSDGNVVVV